MSSEALPGAGASPKFTVEELIDRAQAAYRAGNLQVGHAWLAKIHYAYLDLSSAHATVTAALEKVDVLLDAVSIATEDGVELLGPSVRDVLEASIAVKEARAALAPPGGGGKTKDQEPLSRVDGERRAAGPTGSTAPSDRLVLDEYGRACWEAGYAAAQGK